jgi:hypothetical protein
MKPDSIQKGVYEAFSDWLSNHEISFPQLLEDAIGRVFAEWAEDHSTEIIAAIAKQYANLHPE